MANLWLKQFAIHKSRWCLYCILMSFYSIPVASTAYYWILSNYFICDAIFFLVFVHSRLNISRLSEYLSDLTLEKMAT